MSIQSSRPTVESLESRQLFCGTAAAVTPDITPAVSSALTRAATVAPKILGPSAVEGTYHGDAIVGTGASADTVQIKITITPTSITLHATGFGKSVTVLTSKQFKEIRKGKFSLDLTVDHEAFAFTGTVTDSGDRIAGSFSAGSGASGIAGTFVLKKIVVDS